MSHKSKYIQIDRTNEDKKEYIHLDKQLKSVELPSSIDLRNKMPPVYDQGELGSCTANALCGAIEADCPGFMGSRLFLYYNERLIEHTVNSDSGAQLSDGIKTLKKNGICSEDTWPYDINHYETKPPAYCYIEAKRHVVTSVKNIRQDINTMKNWLNLGFPFVLGIEIFNEFESDEVASSGIVPMPTNSSTFLGGHAILVVGYDDSRQQWLCRNSWGCNWGIEGYFYLPYPYLLDTSLSSDLWVIKTISMR
jgi:C1A family cysteine protease